MSDGGQRASPEVGWGYAGRQVVSGLAQGASMAVHGWATGLQQRAAGQTMQSIAALSKQWVVMRTGERSTRDGKDLGPGVRAEHRRLDWTGARPASSKVSASMGQLRAPLALILQMQAGGH